MQDDKLHAKPTTCPGTLLHAARETQLMLLMWQMALYNELLSLATLRSPPSLHTCDGQQLWVSPSIIHAILLVIDHILDKTADVG